MNVNRCLILTALFIMTISLPGCVSVQVFIAPTGPFTMRLAEHYQQKHLSVAIGQLAKAAYNSAALSNGIQ